VVAAISPLRVDLPRAALGAAAEMTTAQADGVPKVPAVPSGEVVAAVALSPIWIG
jgi:hypothetical protein